MDILNQIKNYISEISKKMVLWLFLVLDVLGAAVSVASAKLELPVPFYLGMTLIGFLWASFQVYRESPAITLKISKLSPELIEGHEYTYDIPAIDQQLKDEVPSAAITAHLRITNIGTLGVEVLSIYAKYECLQHPWSIDESKPFYINGEEPPRSIKLAPGKIMLCNLHSTINPSPSSNARLFAVRMSLIDMDQPDTLVIIIIETIDERGKVAQYALEFPVYSKPLRDLYINLWQNTNQEELVILAKGNKQNKAFQINSKKTRSDG